MRKRELEASLKSVTEQLDRKPRPRVPWNVLEAALAVVLILEQHAEVMSTEIGAGVAQYQKAMQRAGDLRRSVENAVNEWGSSDTPSQIGPLNESAQALYEELTS